MKSLKTPRLDASSRKTTYNLFSKDIRKIKKELQGVPVSKASAIILKEWEKVNASDKKMKKYRDLYQKEKRRHEETVQRYQEDHMDEMEIINLLKRCNRKTRNTPKPPKSNDDEQKPKKLPKSPEFIDLSEEKQKPKKASGPSDGKKFATKAGNNTIKETQQPKIVPKSPEFFNESNEEEEEEPPKDNKGKKYLLYWG